MFVAKLGKQLLPTPEIHGSNQVTGNFYWTNISYQLFVEKTKIKKKSPGMAHFFKLNIFVTFFNWLYDADLLSNEVDSAHLRKGFVVL